MGIEFRAWPGSHHHDFCISRPCFPAGDTGDLCVSGTIACLPLPIGEAAILFPRLSSPVLIPEQSMPASFSGRVSVVTVTVSPKVDQRCTLDLCLPPPLA